MDAATIAAVSSAIATALAAYATWQSPRSAAKIAEQIREDNERKSESRRMKFHVFATIMQERSSIASLDCVRMLNSIDVVYADNPGVREAWAELYSILTTSGSHPQMVDEKIRNSSVPWPKIWAFLISFASMT